MKLQTDCNLNSRSNVLVFFGALRRQFYLLHHHVTLKIYIPVQIIIKLIINYTFYRVVKIADILALKRTKQERVKPEYEA